MAVGGSREAVYASTVALHASPVVWVEVAVFKSWIALLNCRRARGHDSAHVAKDYASHMTIGVVRCSMVLHGIVPPLNLSPGLRPR